jgi:hypothetical protein
MNSEEKPAMAVSESGKEVPDGYATWSGKNSRLRMIFAELEGTLGNLRS